MRTMPAVSVIIPLYNAAKYVGECLDSLLAQTFTDFEVVVVDDCSTDKSVAVVERYALKFGGRLTLSHMETNNGSGALPRNRGLQLSRGEYVFFMDADDSFTPTALEELYTLAKNYDADVVYCAQNFVTDADGSNRRLNNNHRSGNLVDKPTLETGNLAERVQRILTFRYWVTPWQKLVRRNLIFEHEIFFPHCAIYEDNVWSYGLIFCAKRFLHVPNVVYIRCMSEDSALRKKRTPQQSVNFWLSPVLLGLKALDNFMGKHEFFQRNPQYRYAMLEHLINESFKPCLRSSYKLPPPAVYEAIKGEFGDRLGDNDVLIAALCTALNTQQKISAVERKQFNQFAAAAQQRIAALEAEVKRLSGKE